MDTLPQLLQELEDIYNDLCTTVSEAVLQCTEVISGKVSTLGRRGGGPGESFLSVARDDLILFPLLSWDEEDEEEVNQLKMKEIYGNRFRRRRPPFTEREQEGTNRFPHCVKEASNGEWISGIKGGFYKQLRRLLCLFFSLTCDCCFVYFRR